MVKTINISVLPSVAAEKEILKKHVSNECSVGLNRITSFSIKKKSIDARHQPKIQLTIVVYIDEKEPFEVSYTPKFNNVSNSPHSVIVGAGPAGLFAALKLISVGIKPIILERGKDVRSRRRDIAILNRKGIVNPESNYCFGEGGAGAYSDGKLYTRSTKRGNVTDILNTFCYFGANPEILIDSHPHIGTNKLPQIISAIRERIIECGGEVHFNTKVTDLVLNNDCIAGVKTNDGELIKCSTVILATGHSASDIFTMLHQKGILIESKPFAIGVRAEHPQVLIDQAQYHCMVRDKYLPPASYSLVSQHGERGVFSFCMCPGGIIAPAATSESEIVVNGWSPSKRNNPYANSGIVVTVNETDFAKYKFTGPLAALYYRQMVEQKAFEMGGGNLKAPAQRITDFIDGKTSSALPKCSYLPGITSVPLNEVLPKEIKDSLKRGFIDFGKKMKGYITMDAVLVATESRTSSPVRIPRDKNTLQHTQIKGLFPCAEGAGYAGGIVSAAIDGERCAEAVANFL